jgi:type III secretion system YscD/HrpQ family protein
MRLDLAVADVKEGKVVVTGVLTGSISEAELRERLQRDVPGIASIDLQVVSLAEATRWLGEQIAGIGVPGQTLTVARDGKGLTVDGGLPASQEGAWRDLVKAFGQRYGSRLSLQDDVTFAAAPPVEQTPPAARFDFNVRAINLGPPAYITLDGDAKYLVGSRLQNGMILEQIMATGLVLRDGETRHLVEIAEDSGRVTGVRQLETD